MCLQGTEKYFYLHLVFFKVFISFFFCCFIYLKLFVMKQKYKDAEKVMLIKVHRIRVIICFCRDKSASVVSGFNFVRSLAKRALHQTPSGDFFTHSFHENKQKQAFADMSASSMETMANCVNLLVTKAITMRFFSTAPQTSLQPGTP